MYLSAMRITSQPENLGKNAWLITLNTQNSVFSSSPLIPNRPFLQQTFSLDIVQKAYVTNNINDGSHMKFSHY